MAQHCYESYCNGNIKFYDCKNVRFRKAYDFLGLHKGNREDEGKPHYAGVHDILVKNVTVYCDEKLTAQYGTKAVTIGIQNIIPTTGYADIRVEMFGLTV